MQRLAVQRVNGPAPSATCAARPSSLHLAPLNRWPSLSCFTTSSSASESGISWGQRSPSSRSGVVAAAAGKAAKGASAGKGFGAANAPSVSKSGVSQTCACGSKVVYRQCCEPYHQGLKPPPNVESALRARFCAFVKGRVPYLVSTFHPSYHSFMYEGSPPGGSTSQLRRDVEASTKVFTYSNLKVLEVAPGSSPDEAFITFRYNVVNKINPEKNADGSIRISTTVERSRFLRAEQQQHQAPAGAAAAVTSWLFADYELIDYPTWMEEAKQAELRAKGGQGQQHQAAEEAVEVSAAPA